MNAFGLRRERRGNRGQRRQLLPCDRKTCVVQSVDSFALAHHSGNGLAPEPSFNLGKHWLIRETRYHPITILSRDVLRGQNAVDSMMRGNESVEIAKTEPRPLVRATDGADY
jgi:hypothetical protein